MGFWLLDSSSWLPPKLEKELPSTPNCLRLLGWVEKFPGTGVFGVSTAENSARCVRGGRLQNP